jgi:hypothetical protein
MVSAISRAGNCLAAGGVYLVSLDSDGRVRAGTEPTRQEALGLVCGDGHGRSGRVFDGMKVIQPGVTLNASAT